MHRPVAAASAALAIAVVTACADVQKAGPDLASNDDAMAELATDTGGIVRSYEQYNAQLRTLNLPDPDSPNILAELARRNTGAIKAYYTRALRASHDECHSIPNCRMSDMIGLQVQTMANYRVESLQQETSAMVTLVVVGTNTLGVERKLVVDWLAEDGKWRIDRVISGPSNW